MFLSFLHNSGGSQRWQMTFCFQLSMPALWSVLVSVSSSGSEHRPEGWISRRWSWIKNWGFRWRFLCIFRFHSASVTGCYIDKRTGSVWNPDRNLKFHCTRICLFGRTEKVQVMIISRHYQEIRDMLLQKLDLGATMYHIETGYLQKMRWQSVVWSHPESCILWPIWCRKSIKSISFRNADQWSAWKRLYTGSKIYINLDKSGRKW